MFSTKLATVLAMLAAQAVFGSSSATAQSNPVQWTPFAMDWVCVPTLEVSGESLCSLEAYGPDLPASYTMTTPWTETAYEIRRGLNYGQGITLVRSVAVLDCVRNAPFMRCRSRYPDVSLAAGIYQSINLGGPNKTLYIHSLTSSHTFNADGNPGAPQLNDALLVGRYIFGFRGAALIQGIPLGANATAQTVEDHIKKGLDNGWFDFLDQTPQKGIREVQLLTRCVQGMSGPSLVAGIVGASESTVQRKCDDLRLAF